MLKKLMFPTCGPKSDPEIVPLAISANRMSAAPPSARSLLNAICSALDLSLSTILVDVATVVKNHESPVLTISTLQVVETAA